jgi:hypothetical protein
MEPEDLTYHMKIKYGLFLSPKVWELTVYCTSIEIRLSLSAKNGIIEIYV